MIAKRTTASPTLQHDKSGTGSYRSRIKAFFSEEKKQKTFMNLSFLDLFFKKKLLALQYSADQT
jgi:hypothetical protein